MDPDTILDADGTVEGLDEGDVVEQEVHDGFARVRRGGGGEELRVPDAAAAVVGGEVLEQQRLHEGQVLRVDGHGHGAGEGAARVGGRASEELEGVDAVVQEGAHGGCVVEKDGEGEAGGVHDGVVGGGVGEEGGEGGHVVVDDSLGGLPAKVFSAGPGRVQVHGCVSCGRARSLVLSQCLEEQDDGIFAPCVDSMSECRKSIGVADAGIGILLEEELENLCRLGDKWGPNDRHQGCDGVLRVASELSKTIHVDSAVEILNKRCRADPPDLLHESRC